MGVVRCRASASGFYLLDNQIVFAGIFEIKRMGDLFSLADVAEVPIFFPPFYGGVSRSGCGWLFPAGEQQENDG